MRKSGDESILPIMPSNRPKEDWDISNINYVSPYGLKEKNEGSKEQSLNGLDEQSPVNKKPNDGSPTSFQSPVFCQSEFMSSINNQQISSNIVKEEGDEALQAGINETSGKFGAHHIKEIDPQKQLAELEAGIEQNKKKLNELESQDE